MKIYFLPEAQKNIKTNVGGKDRKKDKKPRTGLKPLLVHDITGISCEVFLSCKVYVNL